jgi:hypothetical protein
MIGNLEKFHGVFYCTVGRLNRLSPHKSTYLLHLIGKVLRLCVVVVGFALLVIFFSVIEHSNRPIVRHESGKNISFPVHFQPVIEFSGDEDRIAKLFIADTLPRLMKMGLISKFERNETITTMMVPGRIWRKRTRFVKESLLTAVSAYNRVNGYSPWTRILDDRTGTMYAQVLPSDKKELYD